MRSFQDPGQLRLGIGEELGPGDWVAIDQRRVDAFADATDDHQWIHVNPARAAAGPFGGTVAHGYLTLALLPSMIGGLVDYAGWQVKVNYGSDRVRFPSPVPVGGAVRANAVIASVDETRAGLLVRLEVTVDARRPDGSPLPKPALVAQTLTLLAAPKVR